MTTDSATLTHPLPFFHHAATRRVLYIAAGPCPLVFSISLNDVGRHVPVVDAINKTTHPFGRSTAVGSLAADEVRRELADAKPLEPGPLDETLSSWANFCDDVARLPEESRFGQCPSSTASPDDDEERSCGRAGGREMALCVIGRLRRVTALLFQQRHRQVVLRHAHAPHREKQFLLRPHRAEPGGNVVLDRGGERAEHMRRELALRQSIGVSEFDGAIERLHGFGVASRDVAVVAAIGVPGNETDR